MPARIHEEPVIHAVVERHKEAVQLSWVSLVDLAAYDYMMAGPVDLDVKRQLDFARQVGVSEPMLYIDGEEYRMQEPELEAAVVRAIARRAAGH
jgi:hypothetical protein